jgi:hypothetical protein
MSSLDNTGIMEIGIFYWVRAKAVPNTSTVTLRVLGGEEKGTQCLRVQLGQPIPGGYKYGDPALEIG